MRKTKAGVGLTAFGAIAAAAVLAAPEAGAAITGVTVASNGAPIVGCQYKVVASVDVLSELTSITFYDNGVQFATATPQIAFSQAVALWSPATAGTHTILAKGIISSNQTQVTVNAQNPLASAFGALSSNLSCPISPTI
ncbi:hypothetical protein [Nocardia stercoris]|uniref:Ig-like domain repeat protein n=1 Tax=Nocardia stercoris TaxID=2483361 RepID=A0A3M2L0Z4_9NOCA|nr:hypothetical protein [Nocardia stercoris]RMI29475.1 hypothetical protein EBN03_25690 [Nocardia stercoris]